jgi:hypothetical protein
VRLFKRNSGKLAFRQIDAGVVKAVAYLRLWKNSSLFGGMVFAGFTLTYWS